MTALLGELSARNERAVFFTPARLEAVLRGVLANDYGGLGPQGGLGRTALDTNRGWTTRLDLLARLSPQSRMICCVRPIPWIRDSVERLIRANGSELSNIFNSNARDVETRAAGMMSDIGMVGFPLAATKWAMPSHEVPRLMLLPYDTLVNRPPGATAKVYAFEGAAQRSRPVPGRSPVRLRRVRLPSAFFLRVDLAGPPRCRGDRRRLSPWQQAAPNVA